MPMGRDFLGSMRMLGDSEAEWTKKHRGHHVAGVRSHEANPLEVFLVCYTCRSFLGTDEDGEAITEGRERERSGSAIVGPEGVTE